MATRKTNSNTTRKKASTPKGYTVKGTPADASQTKAINTILATAKSVGASRMVMIACIMCVTQESVIRNNRTGDAARSDTIGYYQQGPESISAQDSNDAAKGTRVFLLGHEAPGFNGTDKGKRGWKQWHGSVTTSQKAGLTLSGMIATVQRPRSDLWGEYGKWQDEATKTVDKWLENPTEADGTEDGSGKEKRKAYKYQREKGEHSWDAMTRLSDEVEWRLWESNGKVRYASEPYLLKQRAIAKISPLDPYVLDGFGFDIDSEGPVDEVSFSAISNRWGLVPGQVIVLHQAGPANGRWLISSVSSSLFSDVTEVELKSAQRPKREPAPETTGGSGSGSDSKGTSGVYDTAVEISEKGYQYSWGGGHGSAGSPSKGYETSKGGGSYGVGYDCSGYVAACLVGGGFYKKGASVPGSGSFGSLPGAKKGKGKDFTVWYNAQHTYIEFHGNRKYKLADTGRQGGGGPGPRVREGTRSSSGFQAIHFE